MAHVRYSGKYLHVVPLTTPSTPVAVTLPDIPIQSDPDTSLRPSESLATVLDDEPSMYGSISLDENMRMPQMVDATMADTTLQDDEPAAVNLQSRTPTPEEFIPGSFIEEGVRAPSTEHSDSEEDGGGEEQWSDGYERQQSSKPNRKLEAHTRGVRNTELEMTFFRLVGENRTIVNPPDVTGLKAPTPYDVFIHSYSSTSGMTMHQVWVWNVYEDDTDVGSDEDGDTGDTGDWVEVQLGYQCKSGPFKGRYLVVSDQGSPSWVSDSTLKRSYKMWTKEVNFETSMPAGRTSRRSTNPKGNGRV